MIILGIDPGSRHTGYGVVDCRGETMTAIAFGRISPQPSLALAERLAHLAEELTAIVDRWEPEAAAVEATFHGINSRSLIVLAQARGALLAALAGRGLEVMEYSPAQVKSAVSGNGRADKQQVARMVRLILQLQEARLSADASDALAVAVCCAHRYRIDTLAK